MWWSGGGGNIGGVWLMFGERWCCSDGEVGVGGSCGIGG